jgi:maltooligosyltrehalose trehalohydrolase
LDETGVSKFAQGAFLYPGGVVFRVWAPKAEKLYVLLENEEAVALQKREDGFFEHKVDGVGPGTRYAYQFFDGRYRSDPAARFQEGSVHSFSTVFDSAFEWSDDHWKGMDLSQAVFYEIHTGAFSSEGTLDAIIGRLKKLRKLGVNAVELMPLAAFDGNRGWGYDGVLLYCVHSAYGGPRALQRLVNAAHSEGLAVFLDVVYNHLGPSGNYLNEFGPYFTSRYKTPWGDAFNYDGPNSKPVREFVIQNALTWVRDFHIDGLRLDAIHSIYDDSPKHIVGEINERVQEWASKAGRKIQVIAESDLNDPRVIYEAKEGGWGLAAQWSDDFHHSLHTLLTGERNGYYADFGELSDLAQAFRQSYVYTGQYSPFRGQARGAPIGRVPGKKFVVAAQNHDQIGNRAMGDRLAASLAPEALRLAATAVLMSPFLPLLFMGEEYSEFAPFQYFTSFPDAELGRMVCEGRRKEFQQFSWAQKVPDPQDLKTFQRSCIDFSKCEQKEFRGMWQYYYRLLRWRKLLNRSLEDEVENVEVIPVDSSFSSPSSPSQGVLVVKRKSPFLDVLLVLHFSDQPGRLQLPLGNWRVLLDSWSPRYGNANTWAFLQKIVSNKIALGPWHSALFLKRE